MWLVVVVLHSMVVDHALGVQDTDPQTYTSLWGLSVPTSVHPTVGIQHIPKLKGLKIVRSGGEVYWNKLEHKSWEVSMHRNMRHVEVWGRVGWGEKWNKMGYVCIREKD